MRYTLRRHLSRTWLAAVIALVLAALAIIALVAASPGGLIRLGRDNDATGNEQIRAAVDGATHPDGTDHAHNEPDDPAPAATATAADPSLMADDVLQAFNCARQRAQLPPYTRDPQLDGEAQRVLERALRNGEDDLHLDDHGYTLTGQLLLDSGYGYELSDTCAVGGFDVSDVPDLDQAQRIGLALVAVPNAYGRPLYQAIVLGR